MPRGGRRNTDREGRHPLVLVADSYEAARQPCARYLDHFNFLVREAGDRDQALAAVAEAPAVILIEGDLPDLSPSQLAGYLGADGRTPSVPIIEMISTGARRSYSRETFQPAAVLVKPFPLTAMLHDVRRVLHVVKSPAPENSV